jgi:DNA-3-methyladenine glycosylase II
MPDGVVFEVQGPYDLQLCLRVAASLSTDPDQDTSVLRSAVRLGSGPVLMEVRLVSQHPARLQVTSRPPGFASDLKDAARWTLLADLDLEPFYHLAAGHPIFANVVKRLYGLKPTRPVSLFEMSVIAITEQQISLAAAHRIQQRLVERFGDEVEGLWAFPPAERLAQASPEALLACGLSRNKANYIGSLARAIAEGALDLEQLKEMHDDEARAFLTGLRGLGPWSADYILVRGLGRPDGLPADDLGLRSVAGVYFAQGRRLAADEMQQALAPLAPYRGLAAFYLLADWRMQNRE